MTDRLHDGLRWLAQEFSATADEFRSAHKAGSDMLLTGLHSLGFARCERGRFAVTDAGRARMRDAEARCG
jgi:hypothetical protein